MSEHVDVQVRDDGVALVTLARGKVNAIVPEVSKGLEAAFRDLARREGVRAVVLTSARDGVFSAGFDLAEVSAMDRPHMEAHYHAYLDALRALDEIGKPVVAALNGHAIAGGAILALPADHRILGEGGRFGITEVDLGVPVPPEAVHLLARFLPPQSIRRILLEARVLDAREALALGVVDEVAPMAEVRDRALALARTLAAKPPAALRVTRDAIRQATAPHGWTLAEADAHILDSVFLDMWFGEDAQRRVREHLARVSRKA